MTEALPKWVMERYAKLWKKFGLEQFSHKEATKLLKEPKETTLSLVIQELKKNGWIELSLDPKDSRVRLYKLKEPNKAVKEMAK